MARRDRVPRHKSHNKKRNKNAKLSPFQREQKRTKLANQVPTASTIGDLDSIPHSQRHVFNYLQEKLMRQKQKRAALDLERQEQQAKEEAAAAAAAETTTSTGSSAAIAKKAKKASAVKAAPQASAAADSSSTATASSSSSSKKKGNMVYASLNEELTESMGAVLQPLRRRAADGSTVAAGSAPDGVDLNAPRSVEEIIARKKDRKHKRKQEARRLRVAAQMEDIEAEIADFAKNSTVSLKKKKKQQQQQRGEAATSSSDVRDRVNAAFERKLRTMEKEEAGEAARQREEDAAVAFSRKRHRASASTGEDGGEDDAGGAAEAKVKRSRKETEEVRDAEAEGQPRQRKRISFDPEVADPTPAQSARRIAKEKKPQDFYDLVDVVRYGERVVAPPVFDVVPNRNAAVSRLANQLEREAVGNRGRRATADRPSTDERHRLLSGVGQLGQQKRLARLGLAPAITHTVRPDGSAASAAARMTKDDEIKALRDRVLATYQRNRKKEVVERKGVDMHHEFPRFS